MIVAPLLLLLQAAATPDSVRVRAGGRDVAVAVTRSAAGPSLRADRVAAALGGSVRRETNGRWTLAVAGAEVELRDGVPFARVGGQVVPLAAPPRLASGRLEVPLQLVADLLPRLGSGVMYDAGAAELRLFDTASGQLAGGGAAAERTRAPASRTVFATEPPPVESAPVRTPGRRSSVRRTIVVDAGHGGPDNGMSGPIGSPRKIYEKDVTLSVSRRLAEALRARGLDVVMTRTTDTLVALSDRGRIANQRHGDLFISVHVNAANMNWPEPARARGYETYFLSEAKTAEESRVERMENEAVRFETGANAPKGDPLSFIINDMAQNEHLRESNDLAEAIQTGLRRTHPGPSRGVKQANFAVLRTSFMPAVLVEIGFGSNPADASFMSGDAGQAAIAESIADGAVAYLERYERRVQAAPRAP